MEHIDLGVADVSRCLANKRIAICGGGGIAAIELPRYARELRRYGAQVRFVVTENCLRFIGRESLEWSSAQPVTINPTGFAEHIAMDDAVIVFPATADLISKMRLGICDNGVTTLVQSALGRKLPLLVFPTMHESLSHSPAVHENRSALEKLPGVTVFRGRLEEGKEKALPPELFALEVAHQINKNGQRAVVTLGGTRALLDPVRCLTNLSTGALGKKLCLDLYRQGVSVHALQAGVEDGLPELKNLKVTRSVLFEEMKVALQKVSANNCDGVFYLAAVSDYKPKKMSQDKISSSSKKLVLELEPTEKLLALKNLQNIPFRLGCKLLSKGDDDAGLRFLHENKLTLVFWNTTQSAFSKSHDGVLVSSSGKKTPLRGKEAIANAMASAFLDFKRK